jgi:hypothetical protein
MRRSIKTQALRELVVVELFGALWGMRLAVADKGKLDRVVRPFVQSCGEAPVKD